MMDEIKNNSNTPEENTDHTNSDGQAPIINETGTIESAYTQEEPLGDKEAEESSSASTEESTQDRNFENTPVNEIKNTQTEREHTYPPFSHNGFSHSGEYRYAPPYANSNARDNVYQTTPESPQKPPKKNKKEKTKTVRTFSTTALVLILVGAVLLSFASGMCGALLVGGGFDFARTENGDSTNDKNESDKSQLKVEEKDPLVINKAENTENDKNTSSDTTQGTLSGPYDISNICSVVSTSVVEVTTEFNKTYYGHYQYVQEGAGSGVIISEDGYILTNAHVITDSESGSLADAITIRLNNSDEYEAEIIGSDSDSDIALIKIKGKDLSFATVGNSDSIKVGEQIIAVGNPLGELGGTVTSGIVSATNREINVENNKMTLIQIDAAINPGNSGGGLFNTRGELIGIVNAKTTDVTVEGLGFAIPINEAINVAEELQQHGYVTGKTHIGISLADVTDSFTAYYYFDSDSTGVYITNVQEGYNDDVLRYGDRITAINDTEVTSSADVKEMISESEVGDVLIFTVSRGRKLIDVEVTCYEYVPDENVSFDEDR